MGAESQAPALGAASPAAAVALSSTQAGTQPQAPQAESCSAGQAASRVDASVLSARCSAPRLPMKWLLVFRSRAMRAVRPRLAPASAAEEWAVVAVLA